MFKNKIKNINIPKKLTNLIQEKPLLFLLFFFCTSFSFAQNDFITTWETNNAGTSNATSITIPTKNGQVYNYDVDWNNDGIYDQLGITGDVTHDYGITGVQTIRIRGLFPQIYFNSQGDKDKIVNIDQWGTNQWISMGRAFRGCTNLNSTASDSPDLGYVWDMSYMFAGATSFNGNIGNWDVGNVATMKAMFSGAASFSSFIGFWNVRNVSRMEYMFYYAISFSNDLDNWDVSSVVNFDHMFAKSAFDGGLSPWITSNATNMKAMFQLTPFSQNIDHWDVSSVTNMAAMFYGTNNFNSDISGWNVGKVKNMHNMFAASSAFNQDISGWSTTNVATMRGMFQYATAFDYSLGGLDISNVTDMLGMLNFCGMSINSYDNTLIGWEDQAISNLGLSAMNLNYCAGEEARISLIENFGWTISGDMIACNANLTGQNHEFSANIDAHSGKRFENENFTIYPNPSQGDFTIQLDSETQSDVIISLYNDYDQKVFTIKKPFDNNSLSIATNGLLPGVYIVEIIISDQERMYKKILITK